MYGNNLHALVVHSSLLVDRVWLCRVCIYLCITCMIECIVVCWISLGNRHVYMKLGTETRELYYNPAMSFA